VTSRLNLVVLGKQGAGKGTQCKYLSARYAIPHISTGDMLREAIKDNTPLGQQVAAVLEAGALVSDDLIIALINDRLHQPDAANGALLDGCTRTIGQARALEDELGPTGLDLVLYIDVPTDLVIERLSARRVCQECGETYNVNDVSAVSGTCEKCGGDVVQRNDDQPEAIAKRLAAYERDTTPLLGFYEERGLLETINGDQKVEQVTADIEAALARRGLV